MKPSRRVSAATSLLAISRTSHENERCSVAETRNVRKTESRFDSVF